MEFVTRIDALRRIAGEEVFVEFESADALHNGQTFLLGDSGIDSRFIDDNVAFRDHFAHGLRSTPKGFEVRAVVVVDGCRHGHDIEVAVADFVDVSSTYKAVVVDGVLKQFIADFEGRVMAAIEGIDTVLIHVKADSFVLS